ncbi:unnamed protein product [Oppiella nova]|uniref:Uncharacterized protein n=1 Tax=Oppiella nova TaxID=334625 RepID=A0A7R9QUU1_9ACAR|nr:unnamed protein product [Oppiella nova]CAG2175823.1 unnamed protein product [Oppiella nova]
MNGAGYKWNAVSLRALFHRLRYTYLNILRRSGSLYYSSCTQPPIPLHSLTHVYQCPLNCTVPNEDEARAQWPYFRYLHGMDLTAFSHKKHIQDDSAGTPSAAPIATNTGPKRRPGRPRKQPVLTAIANDTDSQYSSAGTANVDDVDGQGLRGRSNGSVREYSDGAEGTGSDDEDESDEGMVGDEDEEELEVRENTGAAADKKHIKCE